MPEEYRVANIMEDNIPSADQQTEEKEGPQVAGIAERFVALLIDGGLVTALFVLVSFFIRGRIEGTLSQLYMILVVLNVCFILYMTVFSCCGLNTIGKKLVGIRVVDKDSGEPMSFFRSFLRSCGYYVSGLLLMCGFLLAFIDDKHRALHDYFGHSVVIQARYKTWGEKLALTLTGLLLMGSLGFYFYSRVFGAGSLEQQRLVRLAQEHVKKIGYLEDLHYKHYGYYTNDLLRLSILSGDPVQFQRDTHAALSDKDFRVGVTKDGYKIKARAKNTKQTPVYWPSL